MLTAVRKVVTLGGRWHRRWCWKCYVFSPGWWLHTHTCACTHTRPHTHTFKLYTSDLCTLYNSKFLTNIFNLSLQNLNHHVSFTFWGPWYAQSLCFTFCLEENGNIPAHSTNEDTEAWNVQVEAPLQTMLSKVGRTGVMVGADCYPWSVAPLSFLVALLMWFATPEAGHAPPSYQKGSSSHSPTTLPRAESDGYCSSSRMNFKRCQMKIELETSLVVSSSCYCSVTQLWQDMVTTCCRAAPRGCFNTSDRDAPAWSSGSRLILLFQHQGQRLMH